MNVQRNFSVVLDFQNARASFAGAQHLYIP